LEPLLGPASGACSPIDCGRLQLTHAWAIAEDSVMRALPACAERCGAAARAFEDAIELLSAAGAARATVHARCALAVICLAGGDADRAHRILHETSEMVRCGECSRDQIAFGHPGETERLHPQLPQTLRQCTALSFQAKTWAVASASAWRRDTAAVDAAVAAAQSLPSGAAEARAAWRDCNVTVAAAVLRAYCNATALSADPQRRAAAAQCYRVALGILDGTEAVAALRAYPALDGMHVVVREDALAFLRVHAPADCSALAAVAQRAMVALGRGAARSSPLVVRNQVAPRLVTLALTRAACIDADWRLGGCARGSRLRRAALCLARCAGIPAAALERMRIDLALAEAALGRPASALLTLSRISRRLDANPSAQCTLQVAPLCGYTQPLARAEVQLAMATVLHQRLKIPQAAAAEQLYRAALAAATADMCDTTAAADDAGADGPEPLPACPVTLRAIARAYEGLGTLLLQLGRPGEAAVCLARRLRLSRRQNTVAGGAAQESLLGHGYAVDVHIQLALAFETSRQPQRARHVYRRLLTALPRDALTRRQQLDVVGRCAWLHHYSLGDYAGAAALYFVALQLDPENAHMLAQMACCMQHLPTPDHQAVRACLEDAMILVECDRAVRGAVAPTWDLCFVYGEGAVFYHDSQGDVRTARALYERALEDARSSGSSNYAQVASNYAVLLFYEARDYARAGVWFERAAQAARLPNEAPIVHLLAHYFVETQQLERAVAVLRGAAATPGACAETFHRLAKVERRLAPDGDVSAAVSAYVRALGATEAEAVAATPEVVVTYCATLDATTLPIAHELLQLLQSQADTGALVVALYHTLMRQFPNESFLCVNFARYLSGTAGRPQTALRYLLRALSLEPRSVSVLDCMAERLVHMGCFDVAERCYLQALRENPDHAHAHFAYACFLTHCRPTPRQAERHFRRAIELNPQDPVPLCGYAAFLEAAVEARPTWPERADALAYAESMYREALRVGPSVALHYVYLACFLWRQRRWHDAWGAFESAVELDRSNAPTLRLAGTFLHAWMLGAASRSDGAAAASQTLGRTASDPHPVVNDAVATLAETLLQKAMRLDPRDPQTLGAYRRFVEEIRRDRSRAQALSEALTAVEHELELRQQRTAAAPAADDSDAFLEEVEAQGRPEMIEPASSLPPDSTQPQGSS
jgi:tetratricopeptide (TPR) repeat protein